MAECPHAAEAYRGEIRSLLHDLEENHPGTRHSILAGYERLSALAADRYRDLDEETDDGRPALRECERYRAKTSQTVCPKCRLLDAVEAA